MNAITVAVVDGTEISFDGVQYCWMNPNTGLLEVANTKEEAVKEVKRNIF